MNERIRREWRRRKGERQIGRREIEKRGKREAMPTRLHRNFKVKVPPIKNKFYKTFSP